MKKILILLTFLLAVALVGCASTPTPTRLSTPQNLRFSVDTLTFDRVPNATSYLILSADENYTTTTNSYTFEAGSYRVRVVARAEGYLDSLISEEIAFVVDGEPEPTPRLTTPKNLSFENNTLTFDVVSDATSYVVSVNGSDTTVLTNSYTFTTAGFYRVVVYAKAEGYLDSLLSQEIEVIVVFEDTKPFRESNEAITTNLNDDIMIRFASAGYTFKSLNGSSNYVVTSSDYTYVNDVLTIKVSFLIEAFENNPERTELTFSYVFEKDSQTHIGFIIVKK